MIQVPYRGATNICRHRTKFVRHGDPWFKRSSSSEQYWRSIPNSKKPQRVCYRPVF